MRMLKGSWYGAEYDESGVAYNCGYCENHVGPSRFYFLGHGGNRQAFIYICPTCNRPTYMDRYGDEQTPRPSYGKSIENLPEDVEKIYSEVRDCIKVNAYTASVLAARKILMNVAVSKGAEPGKRFVHYVNFLKDNHYIPPGSKSWVDHIRKKGNEATHEIPNIEKDDAIELLDFTEMLLRFVYELPGKMKKYTK